MADKKDKEYSVVFRAVAYGISLIGYYLLFDYVKQIKGFEFTVIIAISMIIARMTLDSITKK